MCGIAGLVQFDDAPHAEAVLRRMAAAIAHRGPDGEGFLWRPGVGLAHRRLAIIDPESGRQPMSNDAGTTWITFNGEIYNFRELRRELEGKGHAFRTHSDTEVVVHAYDEWGDRCVDRLRGMFAFGLWDARQQRLMLARDRVGIKPLVYWRGARVFAFASELQALAAHPDFDPQPSPAAVDMYLHFQYVPAPLTAYREAHKLPPGTVMFVHRDGRVEEPRRYWALQFRPDENRNETAWGEALDHELREAVSCHTVSDVPFGAFLSGGVDSSLVVAYMSETLREPVRTFSIGFPEAEYDESAYATQVAEQFRTSHFREIVAPQHLEVLPQLVRHYGEPFGDSSAVPTYYLSRLAAAHVKMVLSGDGGDEGFAGYRTYQAALRGQIGPREPVRRARFAAGRVLRAAGVRPRLPTPADAWFSSISIFSEEDRRALWRPELRAHVRETRAWFEAQYAATRQHDLCSHLQRLDIDTYLPFDILTKVDVASMMSSLEVRVPLLDHKVLEMAATMPSHLKWRRGTTRRPDVGKYILKKTAGRFFSDAFLHRPKRGFEVPIRDWLNPRTMDGLRDRLLGDSPFAEWFDRGYIEHLLDDRDRGATNHPKVWSLLVLQEWLLQSQPAKASA